MVGEEELDKLPADEDHKPSPRSKKLKRNPSAGAVRVQP